MDFRILGPLEAATDGPPLLLGGGKQRALLAALLLNAGRIVPMSRLVDDLWGEDVPGTATKMVQVYVSQLRKALPPGVIRTAAPGYLVDVAPEQVDLFRFERLLEEGRRAGAKGDHGAAAALLREALGLWRGPALAEFSEPFAEVEARRLEELHVAALEERIEADLALGRHGDLVGEVEALIRRHPLRERLRRQHMLALYRSGRQAEALAAYRGARRVLSEELGIEPSAALRDLELQILRQDRELDAGAAPPAGEAPPGATPAAPAAPAPARPLVGRSQEIDRLTAILDAALAGHGQLVMLAGDPGIGKTRISQEVASLARARGAQVLWGRCFEHEGAPPFWPWVQAIRAHVRESGPRGLRAELGPGAAEIADLVPEAAEWLGATPARPAPTDPEQARFRLFDAVSELLAAAAAARPLLVVLEDLHAADTDSLVLLEFVARGLRASRVLVVGSYRDVEVTRRHPLSATLAELTREGLLERVGLRGLNAEDVRRFIAEAAGLDPPEELVRTAYAQTEGNPLFLTELARLLLQEGKLSPEAVAARPDWTVGIPEGVRSVIGRRLDRLSDRCNEMLRLAAVLGREFALAQLERLVDGPSDEELLDAVEEALSARVIDELPGAPGRFQFSHALFREALLDELSAARRARIHARIALALEEMYGSESGAHAAELVHHFSEAASVLGPEKLVHYAQVAGERALASRAHEEAIALFRRALAAAEGAPMDDRLARILVGLGRAQLVTRELDELDEAVENLCRAFDHYVASEEGRAQAIAVATHPLTPNLMYDPSRVTRLVRRALELVPPESPEAARLLATAGWLTGLNDADLDGARRHFDRALAISRRLGDTALEARTLVSAQYVQMFHLRWEECLESGLRAIELACRAGDQRSETAARGWVARALARRGDLEGARREAAATVAAAEALRERYWLGTSGLHNAMVSLLEGDWDAARNLTAQALAARRNDPRTLGMRALVAYETGQLGEGAACVERLLEMAGAVRPPGPGAEHPFASAFIPLCERAARVERHGAAVEALAKGVLALERAPPYLQALARTGLGLIAVGRGDAAAAEGHYLALQPYGDGTFVLPPIAAGRLLGLLALTAGRTDVAVAHLEEALAFCEHAGYRPEWARSAVDLAGALRVRGAVADLERAADLTSRGLAVADALGMVSLVGRAASSGVPSGHA